MLGKQAHFLQFRTFLTLSETSFLFVWNHLEYTLGANPFKFGLLSVGQMKARIL